MSRKVDKATGCIFAVLAMPGLIWLVAREYKSIMFSRDCGGHIKRAADSNTIQMAAEEMDVVVSYLEANHLTFGYTSILYNTPDEDISFWYNNLKSSRDQLHDELKRSSSTPLEQSNLLLKLRQTLLDHGKEGETVTVPSGISIYPSNMFWVILGVLFLPISFIAGICSWVSFFPPEKK